ncbi:syntaxin-12-like [Haliotis rubra]|uniref:syntaxin-12-like n=1 Tax=Haliotis rubra TaxID=36100 RepID=UPI001EE5D755|nr:syntaxin-12-like [Haliotis rubra]
MSGGRYGAVSGYRDDPGFSDYKDDPGNRGFSADEVFDQIRTNVFKINNGANVVDRAMKSIGSERDSVQLRDKIHETSQSTHQLVQTTMRLIKSAGSKRINKQQKLQLDRLRNDFQEAVQRYQSLQRKAAEKVKTTVIMSPKGSSSKPLVDLAPYQDDGTADTSQLIQDDRRAQLQEQQVIIEDDLALIREREERIRQLESDILDVNEIFRDLGAMIQEQGETLDTIEANVEKAYGNVETGNEQLVKASQYQKSSRKKMCCLLVVFLVIAIIITIILVVTLKK